MVRPYSRWNDSREGDEDERGGRVSAVGNGSGKQGLGDYDDHELHNDRLGVWVKHVGSCERKLNTTSREGQGIRQIQKLSEARAY